MASAIRCSSVASWSGTSSCALRSHNKVDVTVKNLQQRHELVDGLTVIRLIHEPIELGRRSPESADDLTLRHFFFKQKTAYDINLVFWHVTPSPQELLRVLTRLGKRCRKTETRSLEECACYSSCSTLKITARPNRKNSAAAARRIQMIDRRVAR